jgi:DNA-binding XRE family transcriptional regulator
MDKQTKRLKDIARQVRYIDQYTDDIQTDTDCDQIEALTESIGCISYIIDVLQEIIKDIITDKDTDHEKVFPLKDLMSDYNITQSRLAHELGVCRETVNRWVNNKRIIPDKYAELLHNFFEHQLELDQLELDH